MNMVLSPEVGPWGMKYDVKIGMNRKLKLHCDYPIDLPYCSAALVQYWLVTATVLGPITLRAGDNRAVGYLYKISQILALDGTYHVSDTVGQDSSVLPIVPRSKGFVANPNSEPHAHFNVGLQDL